MNTRNYVLTVVVVCVGAVAGYAIGRKGFGIPCAPMRDSGCMRDGEDELRMALARLWSDHVIWTRQYIVAALADMPDAQIAADRLMKNQEDLGAAIVPFYGTAAGDKLTALLKDHIAIAADLVKAAKADDKGAYKVADDKWHVNATEIATFLSSANPNWSQDALESMLNNHLAVTTAEVVARLQKDWQADVAAFDNVYAQALMMAHDLASGIVKQFPDKF